MDYFFTILLLSIGCFIYFLSSSNSMRHDVIASSPKRDDYVMATAPFDDRPSRVFKSMFTEQSILS